MNQSRPNLRKRFIKIKPWLLFILIASLPIMIYIMVFLGITYQYELGLNKKPVSGLDELGIPQYQYYFHGEYTDWVYNPISIAIYGQEYIKKYNDTMDINYLNKINTIGNWFINNKEESSEYVYWKYNFEWPEYKMDSGWISGLGQSFIMNFLYSAYKVTNNLTYHALSYKILNVFNNTIDDGGVSYEIDNGLWYEEYVTTQMQPMVLNGQMWVLIWLHEFYKQTNETLVLDLLTKGITSLKANINKFDNGGWTRYDLVGNLASVFYHDLHIELCENLYNRTNDTFFLDYQTKWLEYKNSSYNWFHRYKENKLLISFLITMGSILIVDIGFTITLYKLRRKETLIGN